MNLKIAAACLLASLAACSHVQDTSNNVLDTAGDEVGASYNNIRGVFGVGRKPDPVVHSQPRYCYQTYQDVICYSRPIAGQNQRIVGWQDNAGNAGYTLPDGKVYSSQIVINDMKKLDGKNPKAADNAAAPVVKVKPDSPIIQTKLAGSKSSSSDDDTDSSGKKQPMREIIFDPAELEPKQLVPDKVE